MRAQIDKAHAELLWATIQHRDELIRIIDVWFQEMPGGRAKVEAWRAATDIMKEGS